MEKYKISLNELIKDIEIFIPTYMKRVRIIPEKDFDFSVTHPLVKYLMEKNIPYYFSENDSEKEEQDYEIQLDRIEKIF